MSRTTSADHLAPRSLPRLAILCALIFLSAFLPAAAAQDSSDTTVYTTYTDNGSIETWYASTPATPTPTWSSMGGVEAATSYLSNLEAYSATATATSDATSGGASRRRPHPAYVATCLVTLSAVFVVALLQQGRRSATTTTTTTATFSSASPPRPPPPRPRPSQTAVPPAYRQSVLSRRTSSDAHQSAPFISQRSNTLNVIRT
ncbi:hypothetical protein AAT19DRAFT_11132 [Rhodotorula toruloides]|uniref:Proteophosphoglycan ppg4 n=1 Tax=Rhodotorula toruloides TaxID=5286 RepID=A0A2S9ZXC9_RHOTO|nr:hypothetical protein AAT19DRAFT_11132 [Rhodotorula toruloides]